MDCQEILELLPLYIEGELEKSEENAVKEHLKTCEKCKEELKFLESVLKETACLPEIEPSEDFHAKLKEKLKTAKQVKTIDVKKAFKAFRVAAVSAAVIAVCVTALNSEFYKLDNSALVDPENNVTENIQKPIDTAVENNEVINEKKEESVPHLEKEQTKPTQKTEVKVPKTPVKSVQTEKSATKEPENESKALNDSFSANDAAVEENGVLVAAETEEIAAFDLSDKANTTQEALDTAVEEKPVSGGGGGGASSGGARSFKMAPAFNKTILNVKIPEGDVSIMELLEGFTEQNGEYKIPLDEFYVLADKIFAVPDCDAYYTNENLTDEYQSLEDNSERKVQIEEICRYGYVVIIEK